MEAIFNLIGELFPNLNSVLSLIAAVFSVTIYVNGKITEIKNKKVVPILLSLETTGTVVEIPLPIKRGELTRPELLGRIGMAAKGKKVKLNYLADPNMIRQIEDIKAGKKSALIIPVTALELEQFQ